MKKASLTIDGSTLIVNFNGIPASSFLTPNDHFGTQDLKLAQSRIISHNFESSNSFPGILNSDSPLRKPLDILEKIEKKLGIRREERKIPKLARKKQLIRTNYNKAKRISSMIKKGFIESFIALTLNCKKNQITLIKKKISKNQNIFPLKRGKISKITPFVLDELKKLMTRPKICILPSKEIKQILFKNCNLPQNFIGDRYFRKILQNELKFSYKKNQTTKPQGDSEQNKTKRYDFAALMLKKIEMGKELIFIDESSFNLEGKKGYSWSPRGNPLKIEAGTRSINYSLIAAISEESLIGFMIIRGFLDAEAFAGFMLMVIKKITNQDKEALNKYSFIMDNASIHKKYLEKEFFKTKVDVIWTPPYTPELNPIELFWSQWKNKVYRNHDVKTEDQLVLRIATTSLELKNYNFGGAFNHTVKYYKNCLFFEKII